MCVPLRSLRFSHSCNQYFHGGPRGNHPLWDSRVFNYGHVEVLRFLLSNLRFWIEEYAFDGFRFDGVRCRDYIPGRRCLLTCFASQVTSMLYLHHGAGVGFSGDYREYFGPQVDEEAVAYLQLASMVLRPLYPELILIAEDVSGMPTLCRPTDEVRMSSSHPRVRPSPHQVVSGWCWIRLSPGHVHSRLLDQAAQGTVSREPRHPHRHSCKLQESRDEDWSMGHMAFTLGNRRFVQCNTRVLISSLMQAQLQRALHRIC
jgi:hypothetical protein